MWLTFGGNIYKLETYRITENIRGSGISEMRNLSLQTWLEMWYGFLFLKLVKTQFNWKWLEEDATALTKLYSIFEKAHMVDLERVGARSLVQDVLIAKRAHTWTVVGN